MDNNIIKFEIKTCYKYYLKVYCYYLICRAMIEKTDIKIMSNKNYEKSSHQVNKSML